jgi:NDP-sugar pyrophosphorylase family protein
MMMKEIIGKIEKIIEENHTTDVSKIQDLMSILLKTHLKGLHVENYIGDYPTFIEPVYLGNKVRLGNDVLLGPNVYIGDNAEIGDYVQLTNTIVLDNVKLGNNINLKNCIVVKGSFLNFTNLNIKNCILMGRANSLENLKKIYF